MAYLLLAPFMSERILHEAISAFFFSPFSGSCYAALFLVSFPMASKCLIVVTLISFSVTFKSLWVRFMINSMTYPLIPLMLSQTESLKHSPNIFLLVSIGRLHICLTYTADGIDNIISLTFSWSCNHPFWTHWAVFLVEALWQRDYKYFLRPFP